MHPVYETEYILVNLQPKVKKQYLNGREYWVAEGTILVEGVLNGSDGPIFYPRTSYTVNIDEWNGQPITVYHPFKNGKHVSAWQPDILDSQVIGLVLNAKIIDEIRATVEYWFDAEATRLIDQRVYDLLKKNQPIETSTGMGVQKVKVPDGTVHNGTVYHYEAKAVKPDHVAVLPDQKGACSLKDGCGVLVNSHTIIGNKLSHTDIRRGLDTLLCEQYGKDLYGLTVSHVVEVYDREVVFYHNGKYWKSKYSTDNRTGKLEMSGSAEEVQRVTSYKTVTNEANMDKTELITYITANCDCWKDSEAPTVLNGFTVERLQKLKADIEKSKNVTTTTSVPVNVPVAQPVANSTPVPTPAAPSQPANFETWMSMAPPQVQSMVRNALDTAAREKKDLVDKLTANMADDKKTQYKQYLETKDANDLRMMADMLTVNKAPDQGNDGWVYPARVEYPAPTAPNYEGNAPRPNGAAPTVNSYEDQPLVAPVIEWTRE
jgi:hypothetical protein